MPETFGVRLRRARKAQGMSGPTLAKLLGVSAQTVSEWERDKYFPESERLKAIASHIRVRVDWLLGGTDGPPEHSLNAKAGRLIPKIPLAHLASANLNNLAASGMQVEYMYSHFDCGERSFQFTISDTSNRPTFEPGDSVVIDPDRVIQPGDMVLAIVDGLPVFRRYRPRGAVVELHAVNTDWEPLTLSPGTNGRVIGALSEHSRQAR